MTILRIELNDYGIQLYESKHKEDDVIQEHSHQIHQILYAIDGKGTIRLNDYEYEIVQDNMAYIVPYSNHAVISDDKLTLLVLGLDIASMKSELLKDFIEERFSDSSFIKLNPFSGRDIRLLLRKMLYEQSSAGVLSGFALTIYIQEFMLILARALTSPQIQDTNSLRAERIQHYIENFYYEMITPNDIAVKLGISSRYLNSIFKEQYHTTPIQYLNEVRIKVAQKMLTETEKDIVSICFEVGYDSVSTFYRTFKNITQLSPNKYRQNYISDYEK